MPVSALELTLESGQVVVMVAPLVLGLRQFQQGLLNPWPGRSTHITLWSCARHGATSRQVWVVGADGKVAGTVTECWVDRAEPQHAALDRPEAFEAARYCIDALKVAVPIWKQEEWSEGSDWGTGSHDISAVPTQETANP